MASALAGIQLAPAQHGTVRLFHDPIDYEWFAGVPIASVVAQIRPIWVP